ncbi:thioredoxin family protein, partial [Micrococcus sp. SIMBA_144]
PQVEDVLKDFPQITREKLNVHEIPEEAGAFSVFTIPVLLLYVNGKESIREARFVNIESFRSSLKRIVTLLDYKHSFDGAPRKLELKTNFRGVFCLKK